MVVIFPLSSGAVPGAWHWDSHGPSTWHSCAGPSWDHWRDKDRRNLCGTQGVIAGHTVKRHCHHHGSLSWTNTLFLATDAVRWKREMGQLTLEPHQCHHLLVATSLLRFLPGA